MRVRPVLIPLSAVLLLVGAGCGGSSSSSSTGAASSGAANTSLVPTTSATGGGGFCGTGKKDMTNLQAKFAALASISSGQAGLRAEMQALLSTYRQAEADAPDQIKPDIAVAYAFVDKLNKAYAAAGYDPTKAEATVLPIIQANEAKLKQAATHIEAWVAANYGATAPSRDPARFKAILAANIDWLMEDQIKTGRYGRTEYLLSRQQALGMAPGALHFYRAQMLQQRAGNGDDAAAKQEYELAVAEPGVPSRAFRNLGYLLWKGNDTAAARAQFARYLEVEPSASDRAMIESYMTAEAP